MTMQTGLLTLLAAGCIWPALGQDQAKPPNEKQSAKEMFLNPRQMPYGAQDEAPPAAKVKPSVKPKPKPKPAESAANDATDKAPSAQPVAPAATQPAAGERVPIVRASYSNVP